MSQLKFKGLVGWQTPKSEVYNIWQLEGQRMKSVEMDHERKNLVYIFIVYNNLVIIETTNAFFTHYYSMQQGIRFFFIQNPMRISDLW